MRCVIQFEGKTFESRSVEVFINPFRIKRQRHRNGISLKYVNMTTKCMLVRNPLANGQF